MASTIQLKRGTGSAVPSGLSDGELAINLDNRKLYFGSSSVSVNTFRFENLVAENYIVSSSVTNITTQELSGSTIFGDSADDTHTFTGTITAGDITGSNLLITSSGQSVLAVGNTGNTLSKWEWHRDGTRKWVIYNDGRTSPSLGQDDLVFKHGISSDADATHINMILTEGDQSAKFYGHITASGDISSSGTITGTIDGGSF